MNNKGAYILFFVVIAVLQIFLLNNVTVSVYVAPVIYIACIIMMPLETSQLAMLMTGLVLGVVMDLTMGVNGLNVVATLPMAFFRRSILHLTTDFSNLVKADGVPSPARLGDFRFHRYVITMMVLHGLLFFGFEWLSFHNIGFFVARLLCSLAVSAAIVYPLIYIFIPKLTLKS